MHEFNLVDEGTVTSPVGFVAGSATAGIKENKSRDISLVVSEVDAAAGGVFTKNVVVAPPVTLDRNTLETDSSKIRAVLANSGNANACTGEEGMRNARAMQRETAEQLSCDPEQVLIMSTGVIGHQLPMEKVLEGIEGAAKTLSRDGGYNAAEGIMTTDTFPKHIAAEVTAGEGTVVIGGMAKGSGMIHPDMATMLGVLTTDAKISPALLQKMLKEAVDRSFNCISVDGDTSTNDTVLMLANGAGGVDVDADERVKVAFGEALEAVCVKLAKSIVRDGEGATKFAEIRVSGTEDREGALQIARTIATSPLVKTAFAGGDANWGRILAAGGRAGVSFDAGEVMLTIGGVAHDELTIVKGGGPVNYSEEEASEIFEAEEIRVHLRVGSGTGSADYWTTDLTHGYITINSEYRT